MVIAGHPVGAYIATRWLNDRATLERPDRSAPTGFTLLATDVPCHVSKDQGGPVATPGAMPTIQGPTLFFALDVVLGIDWRVTLTTQGNRRLKIDSLEAPRGAPVQHATTSGVR